MWAAHNPAYVATVIASEPIDLAQKIEKAASLIGSKLIIALSPCPTGWGFEPKESVEIGKLAVNTGIWPLKEYFDGRVIHNKIPHPLLPIEEYLKRQERFSHLFYPKRNDALIGEIQQRITDYWKGVS